MATDARLFKLLNIMGFKMIKIGPEKFYEGSITIPAYIDLRDRKKVSKRNPDLYKFFIRDELVRLFLYTRKF